MARITQKMERGRRILAQPASEILGDMLCDQAERLALAARDAGLEAVPPYVEAARRLFDHPSDDRDQDAEWLAEHKRLQLRFLYSLCLSVQGE